MDFNTIIMGICLFSCISAYLGVSNCFLWGYDSMEVFQHHDYGDLFVFLHLCILWNSKLFSLGRYFESKWIAPHFQINAVVLAILIWAIGTHPGAHCNSPDQQERRNFTHSFLVPPNSPIPGCSSEFLNGRLSQISLPYLKDGRSQGCLSYIKDVFTGLFQRRNQF